MHYVLVKPCDKMNLLLWLYALLGCARSEFRNCTGVDACRSTDITCVEENRCVINCIGESACRSSTINCKHNQPCNITSDDRNVLRQSTINCPDNEVCIINGTQANQGYRDAMINCGINGSCYFLFQYVIGVTNFHFFTMNATTSTYVKIEKHGAPGSSTNVKSNISCPTSNIYTEGESKCDIVCGAVSSSCDDMNVFAVNGFKDVNITTQISMDFSDSFMWCTNNYNGRCAINATDPTHCVNSGHICNFISS